MSYLFNVSSSRANVSSLTFGSLWLKPIVNLSHIN
jgi:hypothetical protein